MLAIDVNCTYVVCPHTPNGMARPTSSARAAINFVKVLFILFVVLFVNYFNYLIFNI